MMRSVPVGEVRRLGDRAFLIGAADPASGRALAGALGRALRRARGTSRWCAASPRSPCSWPTPTPTLEAGAGRRGRRWPPPARRHGGGRTARRPGRLVTIAVHLRRARPRRGGGAGGLHTRTRWWRTLTGVPLHRRRRGLLARLRLPRGPARRRCAPSRGAPSPRPRCRPARWRSPTGTPPCTRRPPRAAGSWSAAPAPRSSRPAAPLRAAGAGRPGAASPRRAPATPRAGGAAPRVVAAGRRPPGARGGGARAARRGAGRRAARRGRRRGPRRGPADPVSFALANRLVGNAASAGALELTGGGTGCAAGRVPRRRRGRRARGAGRRGGGPGRRVLPLEPGQVLEVGPLRRGCRTYVAVAGGHPRARGLRQPRQRRALRAGRRAPRARGTSCRRGRGRRRSATISARARPARWRPGRRGAPRRAGPAPRAVRAGRAVERLAGAVFRVERDSNRVGIRLRADGRRGAPDAPARAPASSTPRAS